MSQMRTKLKWIDQARSVLLLVGVMVGIVLSLTSCISPDVQTQQAVTISDSSIEMATTTFWPLTPYTFLVKNAGTHAHMCQIGFPGASSTLVSQTIAAGITAPLFYRFALRQQESSYSLMCDGMRPVTLHIAAHQHPWSF